MRSLAGWLTGFVAAVLMAASAFAAGDASPSVPPSFAPPSSSSSPLNGDLPPMAGPGVLRTDEASLAMVAAIHTETFGDSTVDATVRLLASVGIRVFGGDAIEPAEPIEPVAGPPSPLAYLDWQARTMALEAWARNGVSGADIDALVAAPEGTPPASFLLAAWLAAADTAAGRLGRALMAGQDVSDPSALVVPSLVMALMTADLAADQGPTARVTAAAMRVPSRVEPAVRDDLRGTGGLCTRAQAFVDSIISTVFEALKPRVPDAGPGRVIVSVWNWLVDQGRAFTETVWGELTAPVRNAIGFIAGGLATLSTAVASFAPYVVRVIPSTGGADTVTLALPIAPDAPAEGWFAAVVDTGGIPEWPETMKDCATWAGVPLPSLTPAGSAVSWEVRQSLPLLRFGTPPAVLDERAAALYRFTSAVEPAENADGKPASAVVTVEARVQRTQVREGLQSLVNALFAKVPFGIGRVLEEAGLRRQFDAIIAQLSGMVDRRGAGRLVVTYHEPKETPRPSETPAPTPVALQVWYDRPAAERVLPGRILELVGCQGPSGPWVGYLRTGGLEATAVDPFAVPWAEFPLAFDVPAGADPRVVLTSTRGPVVTPLGTVTVAFRLEIAVIGDVMRIRKLNEPGVPWPAEFEALPMRPAPAGACPD